VTSDFSRIVDFRRPSDERSCKANLLHISPLNRLIISTILHRCLKLSSIINHMRRYEAQTGER
jgi:PIN domain nuclease of toxin-antitoxin system